MRQTKLRGQIGKCSVHEGSFDVFSNSRWREELLRTLGIRHKLVFITYICTFQAACPSALLFAAQSVHAGFRTSLFLCCFLWQKLIDKRKVQTNEKKNNKIHRSQWVGESNSVWNGKLPWAIGDLRGLVGLFQHRCTCTPTHEHIPCCRHRTQSHLRTDSISLMPQNTQKNAECEIWAGKKQF